MEEKRSTRTLLSDSCRLMAHQDNNENPILSPCPPPPPPALETLEQIFSTIPPNFLGDTSL